MQLVRLASCLVAVLTTALPVHADDWTGQTVITKHDGIKFGRNADKTEKNQYAELSSLGFTVLKVQGDFLLISDRGKNGWADKDQFVRLDEAVGYFTERIAVEPKGIGHWNRRALAWQIKGEYGNAIKDYDECLRLTPSAEVFRNRGAAWAAKNDFNRAIKDYDDAIRIDPKDAAAYYARGLAWNGKKDFDRAISDYDEAIRIAPRYPSAFYGRGLAWHAKNDFDRAIKDYGDAIRLDPKNPIAICSRGLAWQAKNDFDRAIRDYDEAIRIDPKSTAAFTYRGYAWHNKKDYDRAIKDYNESIRIDPEFMDAFNSLAWLRATCPDAKYRDGKVAVEHAIKLCAKAQWKNSQYLDTLAAAYAEQGNFEQAIEYQEKALAAMEIEKRNGDEARKRLKLYGEKRPYRTE